MEAAVLENGYNHQHVGQDYNKAHRQPQSDDQKVPHGPLFPQLLAHQVVEEGDVVVGVAGVPRLVFRGHCCRHKQEKHRFMSPPGAFKTETTPKTFTSMLS